MGFDDVLPASSLPQLALYRTSDDYPQSSPVVITYFALHAFSFLANGALLITFSAFPRRRLHRDACIKNLLVIFLLCNLSTSLLLLSGHLWEGSEPSYRLCLVNGAFVNGGSNAMGAAALGLVFRIFLKILSSKGILMNFSSSPLLTIALIVHPYAWWAGYFVASILSVRDRRSVHKASFYCVVENSTITSISTYSVAVIEGLTIVFQVAIGILLFLHARELRSYSSSSNSLRGATGAKESPFTMKMKGVSLALIARVALFSVCVLIALVVSLIVADDFTSLVPDMFITAIAPTAAFIFASQRDVLEAWRILPPRASTFIHVSSDRPLPTETLDADLQTSSYSLPNIPKRHPVLSVSKEDGSDDPNISDSIEGESTAQLNLVGGNEGRWWRGRRRDSVRTRTVSSSSEIRTDEKVDQFDSKGRFLVTFETEEVSDQSMAQDESVDVDQKEEGLGSSRH